MILYDMDEYSKGALLKVRKPIFVHDIDSGQGKWIYSNTPIMVVEYRNRFLDEKLFFLYEGHRYFIENFDFALCFKPLKEYT